MINKVVAAKQVSRGPSRLKRGARKASEVASVHLAADGDAKEAGSANRTTEDAAGAANSGGGIGSAALIIGGLALAGGVAAAAGGGGDTPTTPATPPNVAPTLTAIANIAATEDAAATAKAVGTDANAGDVLTYSIKTVAGNGAAVIDAASGAITYTPKANYNGADTFTVQVADKAGLTATQAVTVNVAAVVAEARSIDVGTASAPVTLDASKDDGGNTPASWAFSDNTSVATDVVINNFANGDTIVVTGKTTDYSFTTVGSDLLLTNNNTAAGVVNKIVIKGVAAAGFVSDEVSAEAVLGWNFFTAQTSVTGTGTSDAAGLAAGNLDADSDGNVLTTAVVSAAASAISFTENANVANTVRINGFTKDDTITVSNAAVANYTFANIGEDVVITYNNAGVVNQITLAGVDTNGTFIGSYANAQALIGADFFKVAAVAQVGQSIDVGSAAAPVTLNAGTGAFNYTDNAAVATEVKITSFGSNDKITVSGATSAQYSFTTVGTDLSITFNNTSASVVNNITLVNAVSANDFVNSYASAQTAMNNTSFLVFG